MLNKFSTMPVIFCIGLLVGSGITWYIQSIRIDNIEIRNEKFVDAIKVQAELAKKDYDEKINDGNNQKIISDKSYQSVIDNLHSDIKRLHNARSSSSFLPSATTTTTNPNAACFDRTKFERTLQQLDDRIQEIITDGDESRIALDNAREWAKEAY
jgi:hypothetical protein